MGPSNNDSFGSFSASGGAGVSGGGTSVGGSSGVASGVTPVVSSGQSSSGGISSGRSAGMSSSAPVGISSGGPVVISGGATEGKSKKWAFALLGFLAVAALVAVAVVLMMAPKGKSGDGKSIEAYVNEYLSLLATGEKSEQKFDEGKLTFEAVSNEELNNIYTIPRSYTSLDENNTDYYKELQGLLDNIKGEINNGKYSDEKKQELEFFVDDSKTLLSYYFVGAALVYTDSTYDYYFENNHDLNGVFAVYGYPFSETGGDMMADFRFTIDELYGSMIDFYEGVDENNCMREDGIDYVCLDELDSEQLLEIQNDNDGLSADEVMQVEKKLSLIFADSKGIYRIVNGVSDE